jgi:hypothetical protein
VILVWKPRDISNRDFRQYVHTWERFAHASGEEVTTDTLTDRQQNLQWDRVNITPGRRILWVHPEFIPWPSLFDELNLYQEDEQLIVTLQSYGALFNLGQDKPAEWEPDGRVSDAFAAFQLGGQRRWTLPPSSKVEPWGWLANTKRSNVYRLPQRYSGNKEIGPRTTSVLGQVVMSPWGGRSFGRLTTGGAHWLEPRRQLESWRYELESWGRFVG